MNIETLSRYTKAIDALCFEAAHSSNKYDISVLLALLASAIWTAERQLGYDHELAGEINGDCWEDSRVGYWLPKLDALTKPTNSFDEQVALALALHRGEWYLKRVEIYGAEKFDPKTFVWPRGF